MIVAKLVSKPEIHKWIKLTNTQPQRKPNNARTAFSCPVDSIASSLSQMPNWSYLDNQRSQSAWNVAIKYVDVRDWFD